MKGLTIFHAVKKIFSSLQNVDIKWYPHDYNVVKWIKLVIKNDIEFLHEIPSNIKYCIIQDLFVTLNE